jgi:hypothetical protein
MAIEIRPQDTVSLLGKYRFVPAPINYFRSLLAASVYVSTDEWIQFDKITESRRLAPFVIPMNQGRPMYKEGAAVARFKPAYVKPKDSISPERAFKRRPGEDIFTPNTLSPYARFLQILGDILRTHRLGIENRMEWLFAEAAQYGKVTISGADYPTTLIDFQRDPSHTITLSGAGVVWSDVNAPIVTMLNTWVEKIRRADFGGPVTRITIGKNVVGPFLANKQVQETRNLLIRGTDGVPPASIRQGDYSEMIFKLGNYEVWTTSDWYEKMDGSIGEFMNPNGVLLTGPNANFVECYGAILDTDAQLQALPVFPKQWKNEDPSVTYVMTQSSPLAVPINPNNTLFATVL